MELLEGCPYSAAKNCSETTMRSDWGTPSSTSMSTSPGKWSLRQCFQHWGLNLEERVGHCVANAWASCSCERPVPSQVCACSIDLYDNDTQRIHLHGETTMLITTTSEQDCCQLNQRYTTCYMDPPHNCNEQLPTVYQPRTDVTALSDMWGTKGAATRSDSHAGSLRLPCTWVNRNVWHVARMSRTRDNRVKSNYTSFYFRADSAARAVRLPNQSAADT